MIQDGFYIGEEGVRGSYKIAVVFVRDGVVKTIRPIKIIGPYGPKCEPFLFKEDPYLKFNKYENWPEDQCYCSALKSDCKRKTDKCYYYATIHPLNEFEELGKILIKDCQKLSVAICLLHEFRKFYKR